MIKRAFFGLGLAALFAVSAQASIISFSQAQYLSMTGTFTGASGAYIGSTTMSAGPGAGAYDGETSPAMSGIAGSQEYLNVGGGIYYSLTGASLSAFDGAFGAGDVFTAVGFNDNNQTWRLGIWYQTSTGLYRDFASVVAGTGPGFSLTRTDTGTLTGAGVFVENIITQGDQFHASWTVPEPTSLAVWTLCGALGLILRASPAKVTVSTSERRIAVFGRSVEFETIKGLVASVTRPFVI